MPPARTSRAERTARKETRHPASIHQHTTQPLGRGISAAAEGLRFYLAFPAARWLCPLCFPRRSPLLERLLLEAVAVVLRDLRAVARQHDDGRRRLLDDGGAVDDVAVDEPAAREDRRHLEIVVLLEINLAERGALALLVGEVAVRRQFRLGELRLALMLADGLDAPRDALDVRIVLDGERALVFLVERLLHRLDARRRDLEVLVEIRRDVDGQLVDLERIVRLHVELDALVFLLDVVAREELHRLVAQRLEERVDALVVEIRRRRVVAAAILRDDIGEETALRHAFLVCDLVHERLHAGDHAVGEIRRRHRGRVRRLRLADDAALAHLHLDLTHRPVVAGDVAGHAVQHARHRARERRRLAHVETARQRVRVFREIKRDRPILGMRIALDVDRDLRYDALDGICLDVVLVMALRQLLELLAPYA